MNYARIAIYAALGAIVTALLLAVYTKGRHDAGASRDVAQARKMLRDEAHARDIESDTRQRVADDAADTTTQADSAAEEIAAIRRKPDPVPTAPSDTGAARGDPDAVRPLSADDARILRLADEARAAAVESAARVRTAHASP